MDINAIWAPRALEAIATILAALPAAGVSRQALDSIAPDLAKSTLGDYLADTTSLGRAIDVWNRAWRHFVVALGPREISTQVGAKLAWLPPAEGAYWRGIMTGQPGAGDSLAFLALALDSAGRPIPVVNTDPATELFLDATSPRPARLDALESFMRPYPAGLFVDRLGPVVANDAYAPRRVWEAFAKDAYHSPRVVWGREVNLLLLGLAHVVDRASGQPAGPSVGRAADALRRTLAAVTTSGLEHNELWSYRIEAGRLLPTRYGTSSDVQLWSSTDLAVQYLLARLPSP
jgi:hypothetical protein